MDLTLCENPACGTLFTPAVDATGRPARFCELSCRAAVARTKPGYRASHERSFRRWYEKNASWQGWRNILRRQGQLTAEREQLLDGLRGRGHVDPDEVRALLGLGPSRAVHEVSPARFGSPSAKDLGAQTMLRVSVPLALSDTRLLHAVLTGLHGQPHCPYVAPWSLEQRTPREWVVRWRERPDAEVLAGTDHEVLLGLDRATITFGIARTVEAPRRLAPGWRRVRIEALRPVVQYRHGRSIAVLTPTHRSLASALARVAAWVDPNLHGNGGSPEQVRGLAVRETHAETEPQSVRLGGKYGSVRGWVGTVEAEVTATGAWLCLAAEQLGLGGKTALGLGRIRVSVLS